MKTRAGVSALRELPVHPLPPDPHSNIAVCSEKDWGQERFVRLYPWKQAQNDIRHLTEGSRTINKHRRFQPHGPRSDVLSLK